MPLPTIPIRSSVSLDEVVLAELVLAEVVLVEQSQDEAV